MKKLLPAKVLPQSLTNLICNCRLRVSKVELSDKGFYHCQLATHPPQLIWTYLDIVKPSFRYLLNTFISLS